MWIKICGITSLEDAELAVAAGADAVGFVFAESPRRMTPHAAGRIVERLPQAIEKIGVFVDAPADAIAATQKIAGLTGVQLQRSCHDGPNGSRRPGAQASESFDRIRVIEVVRYSGDADEFRRELSQWNEKAGIAEQQGTILVDTCIPGKQGGTGVAFDWAGARAGFLHPLPHLRLIAAGGLRPENVQAAIQTLEPWGVDVSSGVESSPGRKDPQRVRDFIQAARGAWTELGKAALSMKK